MKALVLKVETRQRPLRLGQPYRATVATDSYFRLWIRLPDGTWRCYTRVARGTGVEIAAAPRKRRR
jgi:hypothetical protein